MTDHRATVRDVEIAYQREGSGPDVIWGHGLSQTRVHEDALALIQWQGVPASVVRYDARGHGMSQTTPELSGYSWEELARDQLALADVLRIDQYVAGGASMGCGTALHAAVLAPHRVTRLILALPPTGWESRAAQAEQWEVTARLIESDGVEAVIAARALVDPPEPFIGDEEHQERQAAAIRAWDPARLAHVMRGAAKADLPDREQLTSITIPSLILAWTGDPIHPMSTAETLLAMLPDAELHVASTRAQLQSWTSLIATFIDDTVSSCPTWS